MIGAGSQDNFGFMSYISADISDKVGLLPVHSENLVLIEFFDVTASHW
jgi:hypothetical protein